MTPMKRLLRLAMILAVAGLLGCGEKPGRQVTITSVDGRVSLAGTPLQDGVVSLEAPASGFAASAKLTPEGTFSICRIPAGSYRITVTPPELPPPGETPPPRPATMGPLRKPPAKYHALASSGLTAEVPADGVKELVLDLQ